MSSARFLAIPDFFLDILLYPHSPTLEELLEAIRETGEHGGGNVLVRSIVRPGGNAGNTARVLAALGRNVALGVVGARVAAELARILMPSNVDIEWLGGWGICVSSIIEARRGDRLVNIMLSDKECLSSLGRDAAVTKSLADLVSRGWTACAAVNIAAWGNPLNAAEEVEWRKCRILLLDTSDMRGRDPETLLQALSLMRGSERTILGLNENEAAYLAYRLGAGHPKRLLGILAERLGYTVCLHTPRMAVCEPEHVEEPNPFYTDNPATATGAGDAWNAGLLDALAQGASLAEALFHAHRVASCYVTKGDPCSRSQLPGAGAVKRGV